MKWKDMVMIFFGWMIAKGRREMEEAIALARSEMTEYVLKLQGRRKKQYMWWRMANERSTEKWKTGLKA